MIGEMGLHLRRNEYGPNIEHRQCALVGNAIFYNYQKPALDKICQIINASTVTIDVKSSFLGLENLSGVLDANLRMINL